MHYSEREASIRSPGMKYQVTQLFLTKPYSSKQASIAADLGIFHVEEAEAKATLTVPEEYSNLSYATPE